MRNAAGAVGNYLGDTMKYLGREPGVKAAFLLVLMSGYLASVPEEPKAESVMLAVGFSMVTYLVFVAKQKNGNVTGDALLFNQALLNQALLNQAARKGKLDAAVGEGTTAAPENNP